MPVACLSRVRTVANHVGSYTVLVGDEAGVVRLGFELDILETSVLQGSAWSCDRRVWSVAVIIYYCLGVPSTGILAVWHSASLVPRPPTFLRILLLFSATPTPVMLLSVFPYALYAAPVARDTPE